MCGRFAAAAAEPAISPAGRLFIRLLATATMVPAPSAVAGNDSSVAACSHWLSAPRTPVRPNPSTRTNRPATSGSTSHEIPLSRSHGASRLRRNRTRTVEVPAMKVGSPSCQSKADASRSTRAVMAIPHAARRPSLERPKGTGRPPRSRTH